jgi:ribosome-associated protein
LNVHDDKSRTDEELPPSRSQKRRDALEVLALAEKLVALPESALDRLPLPDQIRDAVDDTRRIHSNVAHKRQLHYLAKLMRREEDETLEAWRQQLEPDREQTRRETALLHRLEQWRERLIEDPDGTLGALLEEFPSADRHHIRQLARQARTDRLENRRPTAFRELFRELRELHAGDDD